MGGHSSHPHPTHPPTASPTIRGSCASGSYTYCAQHGEICIIPADIAEGYMSYGSAGNFIFRPFTKTKGKSWSFECSNNWGDQDDEYFGKNQCCCYASLDTGFSVADSYNEINYGQALDINGTVVVKECTDENIGCMYSVYSNKYLKVPEVENSIPYISYRTSAISIIDKITWTQCGSNGYCSGLGDNNMYWIKFGIRNNNMFNYKLIGSTESNGQIPCESNVFGNLIDCSMQTNGLQCQNYSKSDALCWMSEAQYMFTGPTGRWNLLQSCAGCTTKHTVSVGMTTTSTETTSETLSYAVKEAFSEGFEFETDEHEGPVSEDESFNEKYSLSDTESSAVTESVADSFAYTVEQSYTQICSKGALYQWNMYITESTIFGEFDISVLTNEFLCIGYNDVPQCPATFCKDENCQQCTINLNVMKTNSQTVSPKHSIDTGYSGNMKIGIVFACIGVVAVIVFCIWLIRFVYKKCKLCGYQEY